MKNLAVRTASGAVFAAIVIGATVLSKWSFGILVLAVIIGGMHEFYRLCRQGGIEPLRILGMTAAVVLFAIGFALFLMIERDADFGIHDNIKVAVALFCGVFLLLIVPATFICELWHKSLTPLANIAATLMAVAYVAAPMTMLLFIPLMLGSGVWQPRIALSYIVIMWVNDVFAYLVGVCCGKHKMSPRISPKKSWEGFFGGIIAATATGVLCGWIIDGRVVLWGGLALLVAMTGVAGDFVESLFKRSVGVKDSGKIMPGHGGFLDRFDALLLSAPFAFVYLLLGLLS